MDNNLTKIILALLALLVGMVITISIKIKKNKTVQKGNIVHGDQAGGNIHKT